MRKKLTKRTLKDVLESHPLVLLVGVVLATVSIAAGTSMWFTTQKAEIQKSLNQAELTKVQAEMSKVERNLLEQVNDLKFRLVSIERRLEGKKIYLDIASIPISRTEIQTLPRQYEAFSDGQIFISIPVFSSWEKLFISQLDKAKMILGDELGDIIQQSALGKVLSERNLLMWRDKKASMLRLSGLPGGIGLEKLTFFPSLTVLPIDRQFLRRILKGVSALYEEPKDKEQSVVETKEQIVSLLGEMKEPKN